MLFDWVDRLGMTMNSTTQQGVEIALGGVLTTLAQVLYGALKSQRIGSRNANGVRVRSFTICLGAMPEVRHAAMYLVG